MARTKGSPNQRSLETKRRLEAMGCDPIKGLYQVAKRAYKAGDLALEGQMYKELAKYYAPQLRAVEVHADVNHTGGVLMIPARIDNEAWRQQADAVIEHVHQELLTEVVDA